MRKLLRRVVSAGVVLALGGCASLSGSSVELDFIPNDMDEVASQLESAVAIAEIGFYVMETVQRSRGADELELAEQREKFENAVEMINLCIDALEEIDSVVE